MLSRWRKEYREGKIVVDKRKKVKDVKKQKAELTKVKKLEQENKRLKEELNLLKVVINELVINFHITETCNLKIYVKKIMRLTKLVDYLMKFTR
jgi:hypothetical protein